MNIILTSLHLTVQVYGCIHLILYLCAYKKTRLKSMTRRQKSGVDPLQSAQAGNKAGTKSKPTVASQQQSRQQKSQQQKSQLQQSQPFSGNSPQYPIVDKKEGSKGTAETQNTNPLKMIKDPELDKENPEAVYYTDEGQDDTNQDAPSICETKGPPSDDQKPVEAPTALSKMEQQSKATIKAQ